MDPQRFERIQRLFEEALEREPSARSSFLSELRDRDADLADEVESLLAADADAGEFLTGSPGDALAALGRLKRAMPDTDAFRSALGDRYAIEGELGRGGMATVYLATDLKHDRSVALKVLSPEFGGAKAVERFQREIRIAGQLQHPHILPIFGSGEAAGFLYYVMPYVEGESLAERLRREPQLPLDEALRVTREVADALEYAHRHGVVHRDIKPGNILLSGKHALVADFGIAKAVTAASEGTLTESGVAVGTPTYMSPEQSSGQELDARSDIYSLACVLYEMLAGAPPFTGPNPRVVFARHAVDTVPPVRTARPTVPAEVSEAIEKALAKTPADRWSSVAEFVAALETADTSAGSGRQWRLPALFKRPRILGAGIAVLLLFGFAGAYVLIRDRGRSFAPAEAVAEAADAVAVLPFTVRGTAPEEWREGVVDLLSTGLDGAGALRAINSRTILARWNELIPDSIRVDEGLALDVARQTGARYALLGSAVGLGSHIRLVGHVYDLETGRRLGEVQADGARDSILAVMDRLAVLTLEIVLRKKREDVPRVQLSSVTTSSLPALKAYLEGESLLRGSQFKAAIDAFERAVLADSLFALAYYGLFRAASFEYGPTSPLRIDARQRAFELIHRLPEREALLVRLSMEWRDPGEDFPEKVLKPLEEAVVKYPEDADIWHELAAARLWVLESVGSWETVREPLLRAVELAPRFAPYWLRLIEFTFVHDGDSAVVAQRIDNYASVSSDVRRIKLFRITRDLAYGDSAHSTVASAQLDSLETDDLNEILFYLGSPRNWPAFKQVAQAMYRNGTREDKDSAMVSLARNAITKRGRLGEGFGYLDDPILPAARVRKLLYYISMHGIPLVEARIDSLGSPNVERAEREETFLHGVYAADHGRWNEHRAAVARLDRLADSLIAAGQSARRVQAGSWALEARALWRRGQTEQALVALQDTLHALPLDVYLWAGRMAHETGRLRQAARRYEHFMLWRVDPLVSYQLGQVYQALGERQRAREAYRFFTDAWAEADPALRPLVESARRRLRAVE